MKADLIAESQSESSKRATSDPKGNTKWTRRKLGEMIAIKHGFAFKSKYFIGTGVHCVLTPGHFYESGGFRDLEQQQKYYCGPFPNEYVLSAGDVLVVMTEQAPGLLGSALVVPESDRYLHNQRLGLINTNKPQEIAKSFLFYLFNSPLIRRPISDTASGTKVRHTSPARICDIEVPVPPVDEQRKIANILSKWDRAIDLTERLIAAKQERRKWLVQQALSGKRRVPGFANAWRLLHLGDLFINRIEIDRPDLPLIAITGENGVVSRDDLARRDTSNDDKSKYLRICPGDIGYNTMRMWQGVCGLSSLEGIVSPAYTVVTPTERADGEFMSLLFKSSAVVHLFHRHSQGLVSDTLNLKWRHFAEIKVTIPEKTEQQAIAGVFRTVDQELNLLRTQLGALREQKKGLMQQLLTGKKRVNIPIAATIAEGQE